MLNTERRFSRTICYFKTDSAWRGSTIRYNGTLLNKEPCLVHELRQLARSDERDQIVMTSGIEPC